MKKHVTSQRGFTLLETLIALFIFSLALVLLTTISSRGIAVTNNALNQTTARFLAQEGIEMVESRRDDNFLNIAGASSWLQGLDDICGNPEGCFAESLQPTTGSLIFELCSGADGCPLLKLSSDGMYGYTNGTDTRFRRSIYLTSLPPNTVNVDGTNDDVMVRSVVTWERNGVPFSVEVRKQMFHWFQ